MDKVFTVSLRGIFCVLTLAGLAACGNDGQDSSSTAPSAVQPTSPSNHPSTPVTPPAVEGPAQPADPVTSPQTGNAAPQISGSPAAQVTVGLAFNFTPAATDADGDDLTFSISGKPSWASFDASTGRLSGTPGEADIGSHEEITIKVSDGEQDAALAQFAVNVVGQANGNATISWQPPTQNTDGTTLTNLKGYKIHYGTEPGSYDEVVTINNAGVATFVIENLGPGTWYFAVTAVANGGAESDLSGEGSKTI